MCERGAIRGEGLDQARRECLDRERWRLFYFGHTLGEHFQGDQSIRTLDRYSKCRSTCPVSRLKHLTISEEEAAVFT